MLCQYRYSISLFYTMDNKQIEIDNTNVSNVLIDYDYENKHMPIIYITAKIDKNIIDDMVMDSQTKTMYLKIDKFINNDTFKIKQKHIYGEFIYFLAINDTNYDRTLDYSASTTNSQDIYKQVTIGLLKKELIDRNKITINDVVSGSLSEIILHYTKSMPLLLEPVRDVIINNLIIPPINSISKLIEFLDSKYSLYDNKYRLFYDYDRTYLLSSGSNSIAGANDSIMDVIIRVSDVLNKDSKLQGIDVGNNNYIIDISTDDINYYEDKATDVSNTATMTIGTDGQYAISGTGDKYKIERTINDNMNAAQVSRSQTDNNSFILTVVKTELDGDAITLNRNYMIQNYDKLKDKNGKFLLSSKKEVFSQDDGAYIMNMNMVFKKAIS